MDTPPVRFPPLPCDHCAALVSPPRWIRVEHLRYQPLCWSCLDRLEATFTPEQAVYHALIIVGIHQGAMGVQR
jgi:hypothetical protein